MSKKKIILVVEDEQFLSDIYKHQLEERGCGVHVAGDGLEALEALTRVKPDVILLDLIMPAMRARIKTDVFSRFESCLPKASPAGKYGTIHVSG